MRGQFRAQTHSRSSHSSGQRLLRAQGLSGMPATAAAAARQHPRMVRAQAADAEPSITLKFMMPEAPNDPVVVECPSGEQLRAAMLENKVRAVCQQSRPSASSQAANQGVPAAHNSMHVLFLCHRWTFTRLGARFGLAGALASAGHA